MLGPGCGARGDDLYDALKRGLDPGEIATTWITKTHCLGICPKRGATVAVTGSHERIVTEVVPEDVDALFRREPTAPTIADLARELDALEELQRKKVLDLARRLKPGLTLEDVQNPHDFPELADPDWHYADGVLAGIQSVKSALLALNTRARSGKDDEEGAT